MSKSGAASCIDFRVCGRSARAATSLLLLVLAKPTLAADEALVQVIQIGSGLGVTAHATEPDEYDFLEWYTGTNDYLPDIQSFGFKWEMQCSGERNGVPLEACKMARDRSGGDTLTLGGYPLEHSTKIKGGATAKGSITFSVTDNGPQLFRVSGLVEGSVEVSGAGGENARQSANFNSGWGMTISIRRPSKVLISNCSMFRTELLPISDVSVARRNICGFEITDVTAGMSLIDALFTGSLPEGLASSPDDVGGPLGAEAQHQWRAEQETRIREAVGNMGCDALLQAGYLDRCGPSVTDLLNAQEEARVRYLDEAVEKVTCEELLAGGFIPSCGPSPMELAFIKEAYLQDWFEQYVSGATCEVLLEAEYVATCDPEPEDIENARQAYEHDQVTVGRQIVQQLTCERMKEKGLVPSCQPNPALLGKAKEDYWYHLDAEDPRVDEIENWSCVQLQDAGLLPSCGPAAGALNGEEALESARNSMLKEMMAKLETGDGCSELLWQGIVTDCEYTESEEGESDDDWIPDDFVEDSVPAEQHEAYEKSRKEDQNEEAPETLMAQSQFLESLLQGTQLAFVIKHPDKQDEDFAARVGSGPGASGPLADSMQERFVIEVRALAEE